VRTAPRLGQLADAGNTTTLAHYLELLRGAGLSRPAKFSGSEVRRRGSSPKLLALDTGLVSAVGGRSFSEVRADRTAWGRLVETAVGAHLVRADLDVASWRDGNAEVDYIVRRAENVTALEVKSGAAPSALPGMSALADRFAIDRRLLIGGDGVDLAEFLASPAARPLA